MNYFEFLAAKMPTAEKRGFEPVSAPHPSLKPHQVDIARWACRGGQRAIFAAFGLGKTRMDLQVAAWTLEHEGDTERKFLIVAPLGVRQEFTRVDGPEMGLDVVYCRNDAEVAACNGRIVITNYERVRDGAIKVTPATFVGASLDEASVLRSFGSKTYQAFLKLFSEIQFRFVFTATPSPNRHKELIHYAGFLGVMDTGEALTRFFQRDSGKAGNLTLYPHMEERFWQWLSTWAVFLQRPSDLGYSDDGYDLPPFRVHWHCLPMDHTAGWKQTDNWGQSQLFIDRSSGLAELAEVKRSTMQLRLDKACALMAEKPRAHWLLWHELEDERRLIERALPNAKTVYGNMELEERERLILGFARGEYQTLATKPIIAGSGCNFQRHCADAVFLGSTYKFNDLIQAVHRLYRFQQRREVNIHIIYTESEIPVIETLKEKWRQHNELVAKMTTLLREHRLTAVNEDMELKREMGCERLEVKSRVFRAIRNDVVLEVETWPEACVDLLATSVPFGNQYEYSPSFNDFGHNPSNEAFMAQMDFLIPHWLRVLRPGRIAAVHVKDRIRFGSVTGLGMPTVDRFSDKFADRMERHGFAMMGRITIDTDVVRENKQTYRLGWTENCKDGSKMGVGMPEYVLIFRKLPSDLSNSYADEPVRKEKTEYRCARWQVDAAGFWRSSGNRLLDPDVLADMDSKSLSRAWREQCTKRGYDYQEHVALGEALEAAGKLPSTFALFPPLSRHPDVWTDISRMRVLNSEQSRRNQEHHVCPLQLDVAERLIRRYSNPGDVVWDPFAGIFTVPYLAVQMDRVGWGTELNEEYWRAGVGYCEQAEAKQEMPTLIDLIAEGTIPLEAA